MGYSRHLCEIMTNFRVYLRQVGVSKNQFNLLLTQTKQEIEKERNSNKIKKKRRAQ